MKIVSRILSLAAVLAFASSASALTLEGTFTGETYYVSKTGSDGDAKRWETAKTNIQDAVDLCADGDTVIVDDGEYSETTNYNISGQGDVPTVVVIRKRIHLVSRHGKAKTHIVGKWSDDGKGAGAGAHRGIHSTAANTLIEGFTIRDCATPGASSGVNNYFANGGGVAAGAATFLVGCTVDNCRAGQGGAIGYNVRPINCVISRCQANGTIQVGYRTSYAGYNTIFISCGDGGSGHCLFSNVQNETAINCTFVNCNSPAGTQNNTSNSTYLYNCVFLDSAAESHAQTVPKNCVTTQTASGDRVVSTAAANKNKTGASRYQYLSPAAEDWRVVAGKTVIDAGDASFISNASSWIPTEYAAVDFYGKPRKSGTNVDAGAVEAQDGGVTPATSFVHFEQSATVTTGGKTYVSLPQMWFGFDSFPGQLRVVPVMGAGQVFYGYQLTGAWVSYDGDSNGSLRYPDRGSDGGLWLTPPPASASPSYLILAQRTAGTVRRVPSQHPTIADAVSAAENWDIVLVAPGTYTGAADATACVNLSKTIIVRSEEGPEKTIIDGEGARRCVNVTTRTLNCLVQGFTLTGGFAADKNVGAAYNSTAQTWDDATSKLTMTAIRPQLADCIVSNNVAYYGAGAVGGWIQRCYFSDNRQSDKTSGQRGTAVRFSLVTGSVLCDNNDGQISSVAYSLVYNSSFADPAKVRGDTTTFRSIDRNTSAINCALYGAYVDAPNGSIDPLPDGNVTEATGNTRTGFTEFATGSLFVDGAARDLRLLSGSPAETAGTTDASNVLRFMTGDFEGKAIRFVDGKPVPGALQTPVETIAVISAKPLKVEPSGLVKVKPGETVTVTATTDELHPIVAWVIGGVTNETSETSVDVTLPAGVANLTVEPVYPSDFYVDADNGDDGRDGRTPTTARKTLATMLAQMLTGDVVHAAPGDYRTGAQTCEKNVASATLNETDGYLPSRAVVPAGVTLEATEGPDVTFITGAYDTESAIATPGGADSKHRKGPKAVRCVTALAGSVVRGFTIRNGATMNTTSSEKVGNVGGGVLAPPATSLAETALIENCRITGCSARTGGGVWGGFLHKCTLTEDESTSGGAACSRAFLDQCLVVNRSYDATVKNYYGIRSSTILETVDGAQTTDLDGVGNAMIENSVLLTSNKHQAHVIKNAHNVLWLTGGNKATFDAATCSDITSVATEAEAGLDANGCPLSATALTVDRGDTARTANLMDGATDLAGVARVVNNGTVDLGAYEFDWRPVYATVLAKRGATVWTADPSASVAAGGGLVLPAGEISASWRPPAADLAVRQTVTLTGGRLDVTVNGELLQSVTATGATTLELPPTTREPMTLGYAYTPASETDTAVLGKLDYCVGLGVIVR